MYNIQHRNYTFSALLLMTLSVDRHTFPSRNDATMHAVIILLYYDYCGFSLFCFVFLNKIGV